VSSKKTRKTVFFMIVFHPRVAISYEVARSEEWAETRNLIPTNGQAKTHVQDMKEEDSCLGGTSKGSTQSLVERGRKLYAICDFNLIEKHVRGNTAIPLDVNELTPQVIDDTLDGALGETPDQPFVGSDLFRGTTSHAVLA
jgi:hypothetical protein